MLWIATCSFLFDVVLVFDLCYPTNSIYLLFVNILIYAWMYMSYTIYILACKVKSQLINEFQVILRVCGCVMSQKGWGLWIRYIFLFNIMITMLKDLWNILPKVEIIIVMDATLLFWVFCVWNFLLNENRFHLAHQHKLSFPPKEWMTLIDNLKWILNKKIINMC